MAQEVTSKDFRLFIEEQKRTNEQLLLLKEKSSEEASGTLLVGELLKQIKQGDEESSTPQGYIKAALPEILSDFQNTTREITSTKTELDEQDTLFKTTNAILTTQNSAIAQQTSTFSDILKTLQDTQLVLQYIYATGTKQLAIDDNSLKFQKQLEFRKEREEARGDDLVKPKEKEDEDETKKSTFAAVGGAVGNILKGIGGILLGAYAFIASLQSEEFKNAVKGTFETLGEAFDALKKFLIAIKPAVEYIATYAFKGLELAFKGLKAALVNMEDFVTNGPKPEDYQGLPVFGVVLNKALTQIGQTIKTLNTKFQKLPGVASFKKTFLDPLTTLSKNILEFPVIKQIVAMFKTGGIFFQFLGKLAWPLTLIQGAYEGITAWIDDWKKTEGENMSSRIISALGSAVDEIVKALIMAPLDLITNIGAWILGKFGFDETSELLKDFSFTDFYEDMKVAITDAFNTVKTNITDPEWWKGLATSMIDTIVTNVKDMFSSIGNIIPKFEIPKIDLPDLSDINPLEGLADYFRGKIKVPFTNYYVGDEIAKILDGFKPDEPPSLSTNENIVGNQQTNSDLEELQVDTDNATKKQLNDMKEKMENNENLIEQQKQKGNVNVVSGGNNVNSYSKSDLTLAKNARSEDFTHNMLMASV